MDRENRSTRTDNPTRRGGTRHRYRNRCVAHHHGTFRRPAGRGRSAKPGHCDRAATRKAAFDHQRDYPGSSARKLVCRILVRGRDSAPALDKTSKYLLRAAPSKQLWPVPVQFGCRGHQSRGGNHQRDPGDAFVLLHLAFPALGSPRQTIGHGLISPINHFRPTSAALCSNGVLSPERFSSLERSRRNQSILRRLRLSMIASQARAPRGGKPA
jgi:hypothetical protein